MIDGTSEDVAGDWQTIITEVEAYGDILGGKSRVTVLNKVDALSEEDLAEKKAELEAVAGPVLLMSGAAQQGTTEVLRALRKEISEDRIRQKPIEEPEKWQP